MNKSIDIVLPVYNESKNLEKRFIILYEYMIKHFRSDWVITIAENGSNDNTLQIAKVLQGKYKNCRVISNSEAGKGLALKNAWLTSNADIFGYMDSDLSTDIEILPQFIKKISEENYDFVIASRLIKGSKVIGRSLKREIISRAYNLIVTIMFGRACGDLQCGFKAFRRSTVQKLLPLVKDNGFFFDTEIILTARRMRYRIIDLPVRWVEDPDSRVNLLPTILADLAGLIRVRWGFLTDKM